MLLSNPFFVIINNITFKFNDFAAFVITSIDGFEKRFNSTHFNEFVIKSSKDSKKINKELLKNNIQGGLMIDQWFPELKNCILFGITEIHNEEEIKKLLSTLKEVSNV